MRFSGRIRKRTREVNLVHRIVARKVTCPILPPAKARWNAGFLPASTREQADTVGQFRSLMANSNHASAGRVELKKLPFHLATHRCLQAYAVLSSGRDFAIERS